MTNVILGKKGKLDIKVNRYTYQKTRDTINLVTLVMVGNLGPKFSLTHLASKLDPI
jgi:hypothetical protein